TLRVVGRPGNNWAVNTPDTGIVDGNIRFGGVANLLGLSGANSFTIANGASVSGAIDGGDFGTLDFSSFTTPANVVLTSVGAKNGFNGSASPAVGAFLDIGSILAGKAANSLTGLNIANNWIITGQNSGTLNSTFAF